MGKFADDLKAFSERSKTKIGMTVKEVILSVAADVIDRSPVGDPTLWASKSAATAAYGRGYEGGNFKANWQGGLHSINYTVTEDIDPTGEISLASINAAIPNETSFYTDLGYMFYITNSLPYAMRLEDGHSTQAPFGMVSLTIADFNSIIETAVAKVRLIQI